MLAKKEKVDKAGQILEVERQLITDKAAFEKFLLRLAKETEYACDTEFFPINKYSGKVILAGLSFYLPKRNIAVYIPINHRTKLPQLAWKYVRDKLAPFMSDRNGPMRSLWHHFKADYKVLQQHGLDVWDHKFDTFLASKLIDENSHAHGLKDLAQSRLSYDQIEFDTLNAISNIMRKTFEIQLTKNENFISAQLREMYGVERPMTLREAWDIISEKIDRDETRYTIKMQNIKAEIKRYAEYGDDNEKLDDAKKRKNALKKPLTVRLWQHMTNKKALEAANICNMPLRYVLPYATDDVICTYMLKQQFWPKLQKLQLLEHHQELQVKLAKVVGRKELRGAPVNRPGVQVERDRTAEHIAKLEARISRIILRTFEKHYTSKKEYEKTGQVINLNSPKQVAQLFFYDLGFEPTKRTKGGAPSTDAESLRMYEGNHKLVNLYLEWKTETKIENTYLEMILERAVKHEDGLWYLHGEFVQYGAKTGRFSSKNPNLQNQPQGPRIRQFFYAPKNRRMIVADYSQVELRILAFQSGDKELVGAYCIPLPDGTYRDVHKVTASLIFHVGYHEVTDKQRKIGKTINFGIIYGMGAPKLGVSIKVSTREAQGFIDRFFRGYPGVGKHLDQRTRFVKVHGYTSTITGRRRRFPEIHQSRFKNDQKALYRMIRQGLNAEIQGSSADITGAAMVRVEYYFYDDPDFLMHLNVHDELVCTTSKAKAEEHNRILKRLMANPFKAKHNPIAPIPLLVESKIGRTWAECK
jgi:DNA polymerase I-like protein with 3'-5' exonuclease and polymerase domains